jgi:outer membrane protein OmpA-like peptidoglycan-associated protein
MKEADMTRIKTTFVLATVGVLALSACTPKENYNPNDPNQRTREGAIVGGLFGAASGLIVGDNAKERRNGALIGAVIGAGVGAAVGNNLDKQAAELRRDIGNGDVSIVNTGNELIVTMPQDILFATDSANLRSDLQGDLRALANNLDKYRDTTIDIVGHTDNTGAASYNQDLSQRRAQSVAAILVSSGVSSSRIRAYGRGEDSPVASNLTPGGRAQNRRVEIIIRPVS